jgi:hypothetical protein
MWAPPLAFLGFVVLASAREKTLKQTSLFKKGVQKKKPLVLSFSLQIFTHALGRVISPGQKS